MLPLDVSVDLVGCTMGGDSLGGWFGSCQARRASLPYHASLSQESLAEIG